MKNKNNIMAYKVGDWVVCEFKIQQIKKISEDGRITEVCDGYFYHSGWSLNNHIFPLTARNKIISEEFDGIYSKIHELDNKYRININFPVIIDYLITEWVKVMANADDDESIRRGYDKIQKMLETLETKMEEISDYAIDGCKMIGRR
jgi:hypothetical protein